MKVLHSEKQPLVISELAKSFARVRVLSGLSLTFERGEATAIVGPNGAGKTTLVKCILGLVKPNGGQISVLGEDIAAGPGYRAGIGYMPQNPAFPENLSGASVISLVRQVRGGGPDCAPELVRRFGLEGELEKPVRTLSGGTRQKLSAVLAFMYSPSMLILDEPTAGLDPLASAVLKDHIRQRVSEGATVLLTSHVMADLEELCDRVVFLMDGQARFDGSLDALRSRTGEPRLERAIASLLRQQVA